MDLKRMCKGSDDWSGCVMWLMLVKGHGITGIRMQGQAHETQPKPYIRARSKNGPVFMMLKKYNLR